MDRRLRELEKRAAEDPEARAQLALAYCRLGNHQLQANQIIQTDSIWEANQDLASCQCGKEIFVSKQLCEAGHHRWSLYGDTWHCTRYSPWPSSFEEMLEVHDRIREHGTNPLVGDTGCLVRLTGPEGCKRGLHQITQAPTHLYCAVSDCQYNKAQMCRHASTSIEATDPDVGRCLDCQAVFDESDLCRIRGHKPCRLSGIPCWRPGCSLFVPGTGIFEALARSYLEGGPGVAVVVRRGIVKARASGWGVELKQFGLKRPKAQSLWRSKKGGFCFPRRASQVMIKKTRPAGWRTGSGEARILAGEAVPYSGIKGTDKTAWYGWWYPILSG